MDDALVMDEYVNFITSMVQNNDFKSACSTLTQGSYINCLYYSLLSFYKIKDNHNIEIYFFSGKYYKVEFDSNSIRKLYKPEIHIFPFIKHTFNQNIIEYTIWDETLTHSIPIFLQESESFEGRNGNLIVINDVLYQKNYKNYSKTKKSERGCGLYLCINIVKLKQLILEDFTSVYNSINSKIPKDAKEKEFIKQFEELIKIIKI